MISRGDLTRRFTWYPVSKSQQENMDFVRQQARIFAEVLRLSVPPSMELAQALNKLDEALMWANAGIARNEAEDD
jgi:hypothetical protein